jgi:hypothetical protein
LIGKSTAFPFYELMKLGLESQAVIALRCAKAAKGGPRASAELARMVTEKLVAFSETSAMVFCGAPPEKIIQHYHRQVSANRRRLRRG